MHVIDQVLSVFAGTRGYLDKVPVEEVPRMGSRIPSLCSRTRHAEIWQRLDETNELDGETEKMIEDAIAKFGPLYESKKREEQAAAAAADREVTATV